MSRSMLIFLAVLSAGATAALILQAQRGAGPRLRTDAHGRRADGTGDAASRPVRDAGPGAMRNPPRDWSRLDEEIDESFPASDPPANY